MPVITSSGDGIAVIRLQNPPVNALSIGAGLVRDLNAAVSAALAGQSIHAIIIAGDGKYFCAGADIHDFDGDPAALDMLRATFNTLEEARKPIVMAMHGLALGGGLELAMAGHYRVATSDCRFGLPEVTLGILPGGGGTQRLPRLAGMPDAIGMMLTGKPIGAEKALALG
ncbi:MAG: enoyl-CoA hydratase-related protein, partial [Hyphomicrobium sp.]